MIISEGIVFEKCCRCLEYDPDLRDKANHMWFIQDRLKFRTVLLMEVRFNIEYSICSLVMWSHFSREMQLIRTQN